MRGVCCVYECRLCPMKSPSKRLCVFLLFFSISIFRRNLTLHLSYSLPSPVNGDYSNNNKDRLPICAAAAAIAVVAASAAVVK